jgi:hypothetical protein
VQSTALYLLNGGHISVDPGNCNWKASCGGFYLAEKREDAEHFAVFTQDGTRTGAVVAYTFSGFAYKTISSLSKVESIPQAKRYFPMGNQVVVPPSAFPMFNGLLDSGEITPGL